MVKIAKYLCKKCKECKVYRYEREYHDKPFKFLYCKGNKHIVEQFDYFPETHLVGRTSYVRVTNPKRFGHNRLHTVFNEPGYVIDHINQNGLDNRLRNLRLLTPRENSLNRSDNTKHPGVFKEGKGWIARIKYNGKYYRIGKYKDQKEAYLNYLKAKETLSKEK